MSAMTSQIASVLIFLLKLMFRQGSKTTPKLLVTGLSKGNPPMTDGFPSQKACNAANVSIWWRHHVLVHILPILFYWRGRLDEANISCALQTKKTAHITDKINSL